MTDTWEERFHALVREVSEISQGIYPAAVIGTPDGYEKRTERMEGWNDAVMDCTRKILAATERASVDIDENRALLIASGLVFVDGDKLSVNLNDTIGWACSDSEDIQPADIEEVARLFIAWGLAGLLYWASTRGGWRSEFKDINRFIDFVRREEELMKSEPNSSKRAYMDLPGDRP